MFRSALLASVCVMLVASAALADAPSSLMKGNWSLAYTAGSGTAFAFGYQLKDMNKIAVDFGVSNKDFDPADPDEVDPDSITEWQIGVGYHYYLMGMSNQYFSPFIGGRLGYADSGIEDTDGDIEVEFRFGGEAFPIPPLSIGGYVAFGYAQDNDTVVSDLGLGDQTSLGTTRSAIFASLYW